MATRTRLTRRGQVVGSLLVLAIAVGSVTAFTSDDARRVKRLASVSSTTVLSTVVGEATFYGPGIPSGAITASGEAFDQEGLTAAHPDLPLGTILRVTREDTAASVVVRVNDRLPESDSGRVDLALGAARVLEMLDDGRVPVRLSVLGKRAG